MKIAVISDTHGYTDNASMLAGRLLREGVTQAFHLGDDYDDADVLIEAGLHVKRVPGVYSPYYKDPDIPNRILLDIHGIRILLTHAPEPHENDQPADAAPSDIAAAENAGIVLFGHTHLPCIEKRGDIVWINPGHLKPEDKKGAQPSYAILDIHENGFQAVIRSFKNDQIIISESYG